MHACNLAISATQRRLKQRNLELGTSQSYIHTESELHSQKSLSQSKDPTGSQTRNLPDLPTDPEDQISSCSLPEASPHPQYQQEQSHHTCCSTACWPRGLVIVGGV